jgi:CRISPR-associated protein Cas5t
MNVIKFRVEGVLNSFRIPLFKTYHRTFLAPTKTNIIGMLVNIMRQPERVYYDILKQNAIQVSVIINNIEGKTKDLWAYKTFNSKNNGRSIIRRDKLFRTSYTIYLKIKDSEDIYLEIIDCLKQPRDIPSLGLDDEIVKITEIEVIENLQENNTRIINSVFVDEDYTYTVNIIDEGKYFQLPIANETPMFFTVKAPDESFRESRKPERLLKQIEYINCEIKLNNVKSYTDGENRMVFY